MINYKEFVTISAGKRSGKPCIRDLRITVYDILKMLANGMRPNQIIDDFPELTEDDVYAILLMLLIKKEHSQLSNEAII